MGTRLSLYSEDLPFAAPRIVKTDVSRFKVAGYDIDNGYPQRMQSLVQASPTAKMVTQLAADFFFGQGFSVSDGKTKYGKDKEDGLWNTVLNSKGQTGDDLLSLACKDWSEWERFYMHINYNALFGGVELQIIPYETIRYGIDEMEGQVAYYDKWWSRDRFGSLRKDKDQPIFIDIFNPDPVAIKKQVAAAGGWKNYKGQVFGFGRTWEQYPTHTLDSGIDAMEAEIMGYRTTKNNIKNNFGDKVIWKEKGEKQSDLAEAEFLERLNTFVGPDGAQLLVANVEKIEDAPELTFIENKLDDKKFAYSQNFCRATLYRLKKQNAILHSDLTEGRFNQNQLAEATKAYNNATERDRINIQRAFVPMVKLMGIQSDCSITPINEMAYAIQNSQGANGNTDTTNNESGLQ